MRGINLCVCRLIDEKQLNDVFVFRQVSPVAMSIGKTLVTVILAAHLLSCFWFWVHCFDDLLAVRICIVVNDGVRVR